MINILKNLIKDYIKFILISNSFEKTDVRGQKK